MLGLSMWKLSMVLMLPLMMGAERFRTWAALFGAAVAGSFVPATAVPAFAAIDLVAAAIVLRDPKGFAQRAIGLLFAGMLLFHVGFFVSTWGVDPSYYAFDAYANFERSLGWAQFVCLFGWGLHDVLEPVVRRVWPVGNRMAAGGGI